MNTTAYFLDNNEPLDDSHGSPLVITSEHPDFFYAMAKVEVGELGLVGERWDEYGRKYLTLTTGERVRQNPTISIGREFFVTALNDYKDWKLKWWREAVQNAVDAGARNVVLRASTNEAGDGVISCLDDGGGMDLDTLLNKFLVLGGTTKVGVAGQAGGFGKAKELLVLPWLSWKIHTRTHVAAGSGAEYTVSEAEHLAGTLIEVVMPADKTTTESYAIEFLKRCYLPRINFSVNGETVAADLKATARQLIAEVPGKANVYYVKGEFKTWRMWIRTQGIYMFDMHGADVKGQVIMEITAPSIQVLTANRDGFRDDSLADELGSLTRRVAKDSLSGLRRRGGELKKKWEGKGKFEVFERVSRVLAQLPTGGDVSAALSAADLARGRFTIGSETAAAMVQGMRPAGPDQVQAMVRNLVWEPDWFIYKEEDTRGVTTIPRRFEPEFMPPRVFKLAKVWTELCRFVFMQLGSDEKYGVGFILSNNYAAAYHREGSEDWLLLNPFVSLELEGELWAPTKMEHLRWLYAAAIHECTHMADGIKYHDESFAAALTANMAKCADGFKAIRRIVDTIKMTGSVALTEDDEP